MNPVASHIVEAITRVGLAALEKLPEVRAALAPYLHARARLTIRLDMELDGDSGPLPDPVLEVVQSAHVTVDGLSLDGPPALSVKATGGRAPRERP